MKNLLIYISDTDSFRSNHPDVAPDAPKLLKVQIENSQRLGWKDENILLFTNFPFQYGLMKSTILKDVEFFDRKPQATKINAMVKLFDTGVIEKGELYWFHDLDAFQLEPITESEIPVKVNEVAISHYKGIYFGGQSRFNTGSLFFRSGSRDIFGAVQKLMYEQKIDEEEAFGLLIQDAKMKKRVKKINVTYNFTGYHLRSAYQEAIKPIKVAHFHPGGSLRRAGIENNLRFFTGDNKLHVPLITDRLVKIFKYHRIT